MTRIAFDMDGVIADTYAAQKRWVTENYPKKLSYVDGRKFKEFLSESEHRHFWDTLEAGKFFEDIAPMDGAVETLKTFSRIYDISIATAGPLLPKSMYYKYQWVEKHLPFFDLREPDICHQ